MDTCVIPLRHGGLSLVQTTDYIYPIVDDPYMMVWISSSYLLYIHVTNGKISVSGVMKADFTHQPFLCV